jgi:molybdopterin-guanine dinucleotide biosynthesis protein A
MIAKIRSRCKDAAGCVPFDGHRFQPLAAVYPVGLLPLAEHQLRIGEYSMREFVERALSEGSIHTLHLEPVECTHFTNMNFPHEWANVNV